MTYTLSSVKCKEGFLGGSVVRNPPATAGDGGDKGLIPRWGRFPGVGNGNPLQYSRLGNFTDRGAGQATVHAAASQTLLSD